MFTLVRKYITYFNISELANHHCIAKYGCSKTALYPTTVSNLIDTYFICYLKLHYIKGLSFFQGINSLITNMPLFIYWGILALAVFPTQIIALEKFIEQFNHFISFVKLNYI